MSTTSLQHKRRVRAVDILRGVESGRVDAVDADRQLMNMNMIAEDVTFNKCEVLPLFDARSCGWIMVDRFEVQA